MLIAVLQLTRPRCTWTRTGTLAAVLVVPHEVTALSVRTREAEAVLAGWAPAEHRAAHRDAQSATGHLASPFGASHHAVRHLITPRRLSGMALARCHASRG